MRKYSPFTWQNAHLAVGRAINFLRGGKATECPPDPLYNECMTDQHRGPRIAFFGGSFDPPHCGHLAIARAAQTALALDTVLFAPVGAQPLKPHGSTASFPDRVAMTRLAVAGDPGFAVSLADAPSASGKPNYTIDTLLHLRATLPSDGAIFCLMGADSFLNLRHWHRGAEIPFVAPLIVASRPGQSLGELTQIFPPGLSLDEQPAGSGSVADVELCSYTLHNESGASAPFYLLPGLHIDTSATAIREEVHAGPRIPAGEAHHSDLPDAVFDYIAAHQLYR